MAKRPPRSTQPVRPPPSPYGQSAVPGNVPRPAPAPTRTNSRPSLGTGLAERAARLIERRGNQLDREVERATGEGNKRPRNR